MKSPIEPPKGTTSTQYHNKAMEHRYKIKRLDKKIKALTIEREREQHLFACDISARDNSLKWEKQHKS